MTQQRWDVWAVIDQKRDQFRLTVVGVGVKSRMPFRIRPAATLFKVIGGQHQADEFARLDSLGDKGGNALAWPNLRLVDPRQ